MAKECQNLAAEMLDERISDPQEMLHVAAMHQLAAGLEKRARLTYTEAAVVEACEVRGGFSSVCELPAGHEGKHRHRTFEWDAEAQSAFDRSMSAGAFGRLD
jgi:hypothetical protein